MGEVSKHYPQGSGTRPISQTPGGRIALDNRFFDQMGLLRLSTPHRMSPYRTAMIRTRRPGGVGGGSREAAPYPDWHPRYPIPHRSVASIALASCDPAK